MNSDSLDKGEERSGALQAMTNINPMLIVPKINTHARIDTAPCQNLSVMVVNKEYNVLSDSYIC